jgi:hypothetical protein
MIMEYNTKRICKKCFLKDFAPEEYRAAIKLKSRPDLHPKW